MRGKLRDKRADVKRDYIKRGVFERKRLNKRDMTSWLNQQLEEEDLLDVEEDSEMEVEVRKKKPAKK
jgi:hypothetical protein